MTLLRDLIEIPERVHSGDFVLKLTDGVLDPEATVRDYVVTPQLADAFDKALGLIESAVTTQASMATYLHGSFGSGKSHFMAVLYLLLRREPKARAMAELAQVVARHDAWLQNRKFLLVPFHLIGARNLPAAILGGYARHIAELHPEAPRPLVYVADAVLENADQLRQSMGDERFFAVLNEASGAQDWGTMAQAWDAERYEAARQADAAQADRRKLVSDIVKTLLPSLEVSTDASGEGFVSMDDGLAEIAEHAKQLGYAGVVLFLDELILWLAGRAADTAFVDQQIEALIKLVEAQRTARALPIISFVARQRDLRKLIGERMPGVDRMRYIDRLDHYEGRFGRIDLKNENLALVVHKRLLKPRTSEAAAQLEAGFRKALQAQPHVIDTLLGAADRDTFRQVYPFSPALIDALVEVSSVLQRERTALKLLLELLVRGRDHLQVGDVVPVGDLWDVLAEGDEPFSEDMRAVFDSAKKLWRTKLQPILEDQHAQTPHPQASPTQATNAESAPVNAFVRDGRLLKTLLLAALAPEAQQLRGLTVARLVALNVGSIRTPVPGQETTVALGKLRDWVARGAGALQLSEGSNPIVGLELSGVDEESILERVREEDNLGNRTRKVRDLVFQALGVEEGQLQYRRKLVWRGSQRQVEVIFGNVRKLPEDSLTTDDNPAGDWKVVIDFPFDEADFTPRDDLSRIQALQEEAQNEGASWRTLCWLPSFLSAQGQQRLGRLVLLDFLLTGDRFEQNAIHLPPAERQAALASLRNQQTKLRELLREALEVAYGLRDGASSLIDRGLELADHLQSLHPELHPASPVAANFAQALEELVGQALACQFPGHPNLGNEPPRGRELKRVHDEVLRTIQEAGHRVRVEDRASRTLLERIAQPLRLGTMHEAHFQLDEYWFDHFERCAARLLSESTTDEAKLTFSVGQMRAWFDDPQPMGLARELQDLVILLFAIHRNYSFSEHGAPIPTPGCGEKLHDSLYLEHQEMPSPQAWETARERAGQLFGVNALSPLLSANNVADLVKKVQEKAREQAPGIENLARSLTHHCATLGIDGGDRLRVTRGAQHVVAALLGESRPVAVVQRLAELDLVATPLALGRTLSQAASLHQWLEEVENWRLLQSAWQEEPSLRERVVRVLSNDEFAEPALAELNAARADAVTLLTRRAQPTPAPPGSSRASTSATATTATATSVEVPYSTSPVPASQVSDAGSAAPLASDSGSFHGSSQIQAALTKLQRAVETAPEDADLELRWSLRQREEE